MSKCGIILNSYNRSNWVRIAVDSVLSQSYDDLTLYIMDDHSVQEVQDILKEYEKNDSRVKLFITNPPPTPEERYQTVRYAINVNKALDMIKDDNNIQFVSYLTDDCYFLPDRLKLMVQYLEENPEVNTVYGIQGLAHAPNWDITHRRGPFGIAPGPTCPGPSCHVDHNSIMHRRNVLEKVPQWSTDPSLIGMADGAFFVEVVKHYGSFYPVDIMTDVNRLHSNSLCNLLRGQQFDYIASNNTMES